MTPLNKGRTPIGRSARANPARLSACLVVVLAAAAVAAQVPAPPQTPQQPKEVSLPPIVGDPGTPPRLAVPDLLALSADKEVQEAAKTIGQVLWDDSTSSASST